MSPTLHAALIQLSRQRAAAKTAAIMPGLDPGAREHRVVDESHLGEPAQDRFSRVVRHSPEPKRRRQLRSGPRRRCQLPQADQPRHDLGIIPLPRCLAHNRQSDYHGTTGAAARLSAPGSVAVRATSPRTGPASPGATWHRPLQSPPQTTDGPLACPMVPAAA
jgi:hypothetical protein